MDSIRKGFDVFLNHRGTVVKDSLASLIFHNLQNKGFSVFLNKNSIQVGENILDSIEVAIRSASVHVVILSANYADSTWSLSELLLIVNAGVSIIPVFCGVEPSELRMKNKGGLYARAFKLHNQAGSTELHILEEWERALCYVSHIKGYHFTGDQGELLERIATNVSQYITRTKLLPPLNSLRSPVVSLRSRL